MACLAPFLLCAESGLEEHLLGIGAIGMDAFGMIQPASLSANTYVRELLGLFAQRIVPAEAIIRSFEPCDRTPPQSPKEVWAIEPRSPRSFAQWRSPACFAGSTSRESIPIVNASLSSNRQLGRCEHCRVYTSKLVLFHLPSGAAIQVCSFCYRLLAQRFTEDEGKKVRASRLNMLSRLSYLLADPLSGVSTR